jgi:lysophospholipase L1-like esterase
MKKYPVTLVCLALIALSPVAPAQTATPAVPAATSPAAAAAPVAPVHVDASAPSPKKDNGTFLKRHESFLERGKAGPIGLLFLGDSITEGWKKAPHIWKAYYDEYQPANFGIGGDLTQHVIWRIENGELDGIHPKVTVLMIGTNNTGGYTAEEILAADKRIVELIRTKIPETKVLLLAIFPRGQSKGRDGKIVTAEHFMEIINAVNVGLAKLDDGVNVRFLDINEKFLGQDGKIPKPIMPDQLHPSAAGYQLWADAMRPLLTEMLR